MDLENSSYNYLGFCVLYFEALLFFVYTFTSVSLGRPVPVTDWLNPVFSSGLFPNMYLCLQGPGLGVGPGQAQAEEMPRPDRHLPSQGRPGWHRPLVSAPRVNMGPFCHPAQVPVSLYAHGIFNHLPIPNLASRVFLFRARLHVSLTHDRGTHGQRPCSHT